MCEKHYGFKCNYKRKMIWLIRMFKIPLTYEIIVTAHKTYLLNL